MDFDSKRNKMCHSNYQFSFLQDLLLYNLYYLTYKDTTTVPFSTGVIFAPFDVKPGHIIFAPLSTNLIAPLSTCSIGRKNGS